MRGSPVCEEHGAPGRWHAASGRAGSESPCRLLRRQVRVGLQEVGHSVGVQTQEPVLRARSIIRFTVNLIPDPDHPDTADTLEAMRNEHLVLAYAFHIPGEHQ